MTKKKTKPVYVHKVYEYKQIIKNESNSTYDTLRNKWILKKKVKK